MELLQVIERVQSLIPSSPREVLEDLRFLTGSYAFDASQLEEILKQKPAVWQELRKTVKSDTQAERAWSATPMGQEETIYKLRLKSLEKLMSTLRTTLRVMEIEARGEI